MDMNLKGKLALVTGGNRGIGLATAKGLAKEGCDVAFCARREETLAQAAGEIEALGVRVAATQADVQNADDAARFVEESAARLGGIDILINNVGGRSGDRFMDSTDEDWVETFDKNVFHGVRLTRLVVPHMRARGGGSIVFISSISGWIPQLSGAVQYGASKAAQIFMAEPIALELVHDRIRVNVVSPGSIIFEGGGWDNMRQEKPEVFAAYEENGFPMGGLGTPEDVADVVVFLASDRSRWVNGENIRVDGLEQPVPAVRPW
ncbi:MAG: SDR family NAD(P)-dependent oxidoreductase [Gemmatimonadetes bacterium]|nr:SDR family NAD(P)-dependent oxidoreductase [Gemmatimonadota bacterium]